jgi:hypothetical protein
MEIPMSDALTHPGAPLETPTPAERQHAPSDVAELWQFNVETSRSEHLSQISTHFDFDRPVVTEFV